MPKKIWNPVSISYNPPIADIPKQNLNGITIAWYIIITAPIKSQITLDTESGYIGMRLLVLLWNDV
jgi:hypothetical protein